MATSNSADLRRNPGRNLIGSKTLSAWRDIFAPCIIGEVGLAQFVEIMNSGDGKVYRFGECWVLMTTQPNVIWGCVGVDIRQALSVLLEVFPQFVFPTHRSGMPKILASVATVKQIGEGLYHVIRKSGQAEKQERNVAIH